MSDLVAGTARYQILEESVVVTCSGFKGKQPSGSLNTFQAQLFYDGRIRLSYLKLGQTTAIVGLSSGLGIQASFSESDFSGYPALPVITSQPLSLTVTQGGVAEFQVSAVGEGVTYQWRKNGAPISGATKNKLLFAAVQKSDQASYDVVVSTSERQEISQPAKLTVNVPLLVEQAPQSQMMTDGSLLHLSVQVADATGVSYQWYRNKLLLRGATRPVYALSSTQQVHAGSYTVKITNAVGSVTTAPAIVGVMRSADVVVVQNVSRPLVLTVPVAGTGLIYQWRKDGQVLVSDSRIKGVDQIRLTVGDFGDGDVGEYSCSVSAGTSILDSGRFGVRIRHIPIMNSWAPESWIVSGTVDEVFSASREPTSFQVKGLPKGVTQLPGQNRLVGKPSIAGNFTLQMTASNSAGTSGVLLVPVTVLPLHTEVIGTYVGLILPSAPGASANLNGGTLRFTVAATGVCTATALLNGIKTSFTARLNTTTTALPTVSFTKPSAFSWSGAFNSNGQHLGQITLGSEVVEVEAWKTGLTAPNLYTGQFNAGLTIDAALTSDLDYPQGSGHVIFSLSSKGGVTWKGKLADGTTVTGTSQLGTSGKIPLHHQLYGKAAAAGAINGWLQLSQDGIGKRIDSSQLLWRKPEQTAKTRSYKSGFPQHSQVLAGRYFDKTEQLLTLSSASPNAALLLTEGKIDLTPPAAGGLVFQALQLDQTKYTPTFVGSNTAQMKFKLSATTGEFSGSCTFNDSSPLRVANFSGLVIPRNNQGVGQFQLPELPSSLTSPATTLKTSPILSGRVVLNTQ